MSVALGLILDVMVLVFLGVTIYYAMKLSRSLNSFRSYRQDFEKLLDELTRNIVEAQRAIHNLKITSGDAGKNLEKTIRESRLLADELQIMNESGHSLAKRLEGGIDKNRRSAPEETASAKSRRNPEAMPSFSIQDREFGDDSDTESHDWTSDDFPEHLQSQAERELYSALQKSKKSPGRRAS